ncbi:aldehyde dehydrogenase family protein [Acidovorax sp. sif1233]|uniref:aldehyde dehydrogenase family protein n=1 Tax=unclassified Acidovorax TaxID=2684926 RepID=UPI001C4594D3|nr:MULTISPECIES: aldehyde dehydrogenase family protein [unclassified Acidovorax]MBV7429121.1 aldehyde dehydrogenase family protein [Acidovorax sp. sif0732]MBV7450947.1 aldehyde dehydrogenase family protein [Acidovorax sp. sif0715]MBV7453889.1 aldehyde dehydrogenase family protein [Acidovorax sp. sif1233]
MSASLPQVLESVSTLSLIAGQRVGSGASFAVRDRYSGETIAQVDQTSREHIRQAVAVARRHVKQAPDGYKRSRILRKAAEIIQARRQRFIDIMVLEAGFTAAESSGEIDRGLDTLEISAEEAKRICGEMIPMDGNPGQKDRIAFTLRTPVGVVCAITPFNAPFNALLHKIAPAIAAGNAVILKPSGYTPLTASLICDVLLEAGWPAELISLVHGEGAEAGEWLLDEQGIDFYTFTGSTRVGRIIQQKAGSRRTQLELGSIACTVICEDADLDMALPRILRATFRKAGQVCTSIQRLYVAQSRVEEVAARLEQATRALKSGDPRQAGTDVGPMIAEKEAMRAQAWVLEAVAQGARLVTGGQREGSVLEPTILADVRPGMKVVDQEIFAPVVTLMPFQTVSEVIDSINATPYGLAAGVFTNDVNTAFYMARHLRVGGLHVNETSSSRNDGMPYGGVKDSGYGFEGPKYAIRDMTDEKVVTFSLSTPA